ncbi:MAG: thermonuclease family protein [Candidatus Saccharibacteria bacterium]|nr:thermonuclease family protein [Candidatus Saccharibacteria bacterium]
MSRRHTNIFIGSILSLVMAFSGTFGVFSRTASAASPTYRVLAMSSESADTFYVAMNGRSVKVRLIGLNAPESTSYFKTKKGCYAIQSKSILWKIIGGKYVSLVADPKMPDKYTDGSLLRYAYVGQQDVGGMMIYNGAAREYMYKHKNYAYRSWYKSLQNSAYGRKKGMWSPQWCPVNKSI